MPEYIDRIAVYERACKDCTRHGDEPGSCYDSEPCGMLIFELTTAPTVDAVEVAEYDAIVHKLECLLCHATGNRYSKASYRLEDMERMVTDYIEERCAEAEEEARKVVHGRWEPIEYDGYADGNPVWDVWECSVCKEEHRGDEDTLTPYCPNCGAKMDGDGDGSAQI